MKERETDRQLDQRDRHTDGQRQTGRGTAGSGPSPTGEALSVQEGGFCQNTQWFHNWDSASFPSEALMTELLSSQQLA